MKIIEDVTSDGKPGIVMHKNRASSMVIMAAERVMTLIHSY